MSALASTSNDARDIARLGQVFTPPAIVDAMLALRRRHGRTLDPAAGDGAFSARIRDCVAIELDAHFAPPGARVQDFFACPADEKFDTIIGNPPYVRYQYIRAATRALFQPGRLDGRANLYLFFIDKCLDHLAPGGELIFITPRDFLKATSSAPLNARLYREGTITDFVELGDAKVFDGALPNCAIWRFEKDDNSHRTRDGRRMVFSGGHLAFSRGIYSVPLAEVFAVRVGAVSGADDIYTSDELGNIDFVCSHTARTGETRRMIYNQRLPYLDPFKPRLLARRVRHFDESNWWQWGRQHHVSERPRVYVNNRTRNPQPFFLHPSIHYDGSILALFPHQPRADLAALCALLNRVDWHELGFVCDGRFLFAQRSLEQALLPEDFAPYAVSQGALRNI
ncbi:MAG: class I SAM-dependent methyltransferase [Candidatus Methylophosphatis roskildensis]